MIGAAIPGDIPGALKPPADDRQTINACGL
jgi:hypothetical protein